jgi:ribosome modulation factor
MSNSIPNHEISPSNDSALEWMRLYDTQKRKCAEENGVLRNIVKRAKADGMNVKAMSSTHSARKLDPMVVIAEMRDQIRYMTLRSMPMTADDLFAGWDTRVTDKTREIDTLFEADEKGYAAGRAGAKIEDCPYQPGTDLHVEWVKSWKVGQEAIARELGPDVKPASTTRERPARAQARIPGTESTQRAPGKPARAKRAARSGGKGRRAARLNGAPRRTAETTTPAS